MLSSVIYPPTDGRGLPTRNNEGHQKDDPGRLPNVSVPNNRRRHHRHEDSVCCTQSHRRFVLLIGVLEILLSAAAAGTFLYFAMTFDHYQDLKFFIHVPECVTDEMGAVILRTLAVLSGIQCIMGAWLLVSVKEKSVNHIKYWLIVMLTQEVIFLMFVLSLAMSDQSTQGLNTVTFIRVLLRFFQLIEIFTYMEKEMLKIMRRKVRHTREFLSRSNATLVSNISESAVSVGDAEEERNRNKEDAIANPGPTVSNA